MPMPILSPTRSVQPLPEHGQEVETHNLLIISQNTFEGGHEGREANKARKVESNLYTHELIVFSYNYSTKYFLSTSSTKPSPSPPPLVQFCTATASTAASTP